MKFNHRLWLQIIFLAICLAGVLVARYHLQSHGAMVVGEMSGNKAFQGKSTLEITAEGE